MVVTVVAILTVYYLFDPGDCVFFPQCILYRLTGIKCLACGMQRAVHNLLNGDIIAAVHHNAFLVFVAPILICCSFVSRIEKSVWFWYCIVIIVMIYVISRNLLNCEF